MGISRLKVLNMRIYMLGRENSDYIALDHLESAIIAKLWGQNLIGLYPSSSHKNRYVSVGAHKLR